MIGLDEAVERLKDTASIPERSVAAARSDAAPFFDWCSENGEEPLPASPAAVAAWVESLGDTRRPRSVQRYLGTLAAFHRAFEFADPTRTDGVRAAQRRQASAASKRPSKRAPSAEPDLLPAGLDASVALADTDLRRLRLRRDAALLLIARDAMARSSELVVLRWDDVSKDPRGAVRVRVGEGDRERFCVLEDDTVGALASWKACEGLPGPGGKTLAPIPLIFRHLANREVGDKLSPHAVSTILRRALAPLMGAAPSKACAHSIRLGAMREAVSSGDEPSDVARAGGWLDPRTVVSASEDILKARSSKRR